MTAFRMHTGAVLLKSLSTGLVVTAVFASSLLARENCQIDRHSAQSVKPSVSRTHRRMVGHRRGPAPGASASPAAPWDQPGGICDIGDNPTIC
jgi:hypothetical protein